MIGTLKKVLSKPPETEQGPGAIKTEKASSGEIAEIEAMIYNYPEGFANFLKNRPEKSYFLMERFFEKRGETVLAVFSRISNSRRRKVSVIFFIRQGEKKFGAKISAAGENSPSCDDILKTIPEDFLSEAGMRIAKDFISKPSAKTACSGY
ncbi:MAG: hypothetical protein UV34_C0001G0031 [Parcubacteria group bacterium GW2011_GWB1_42_6]|nr:MAG: hypothetical protein UV34_C0001G0031 [Parcubacteria group bacterium GW2011_GWB1_42_6]